MAAINAELTQQVVALDGALQTALKRIEVLERQGQTAAASSGGGGPKQQSLIKDPKKLYPAKVKTNDNFKVWPEDFMRWLRIESEGLHTLFEHTPAAQRPRSRAAASPVSGGSTTISCTLTSASS